MCSSLEHARFQVRTGATQQQVGSSNDIVLGFSGASSRREDDLHLHWHGEGFSEFMPDVQGEQCKFPCPGSSLSFEVI